MKIEHRGTEDEIKQARKAAYLSAWSVEKQLEALVENSMGRPEKFDALQRHILAVKSKIKKENEV